MFAKPILFTAFDGIRLLFEKSTQSLHEINLPILESWNQFVKVVYRKILDQGGILIEGTFGLTCIKEYRLLFVEFNKNTLSSIDLSMKIFGKLLDFVDLVTVMGAVDKHGARADYAE